MKSFRPFLPALNLRPGLLISPNFERSCYTIYVTDGTYLWKQSVSSSELQSLSTSYDSPIDAEDPEQLKILFGKLQQGLSCQGDGREGTETKLLHIEDPSFNSAGVPKKLVIHTTVPLDAPLPVLEWRFYLDLTPQYEFTSTITLPLMRLVGLYQTKTTELLEQIKSKDNIITKLKDNAEMQKKGAVNEIFHNKRSRQGLAVFVQEEWRNSFILAGEDAGTDWLYKDQDSPRVEFQAVLGSKERVDESWWDILNSEKQHYSLGRQTSRGVIPRDTGRSKRQSPAKTRKLSPTPVPPARNEDETEDETDDDASDEIVWVRALSREDHPLTLLPDSRDSTAHNCEVLRSWC
ncbi:hypothetical protein BJ508DRAFT_161595 [Ascobolus immersus RN42]|uniref:Non-homologous end-joining factor 1 n=1 Tax=Ascobolus immersus RN42 TaxID=1160509 RepID=A0A3N4HZW0_ASCIM|nr:hypothetical protein BJ508DRAFT_161595 [Ascobolus immersus RN42]